MMKVTLHPAERNNYKRFYDMADAVYEIRNLYKKLYKELLEKVVKSMD